MGRFPSSMISCRGPFYAGASDCLGAELNDCPKLRRQRPGAGRGGGNTFRGELAKGANFRAAGLYSADPRIQTMMQSCASGAKLQDGGPILLSARKPCDTSGCHHLGPLPATQDVSVVSCRYPVWAARHVAGRKITPSSISPFVTKRHSAMSSFRASATIMVLRTWPRASAVRARYH
jgi:hypothetical protein